MSTVLKSDFELAFKKSEQHENYNTLRLLRWGYETSGDRAERAQKLGQQVGRGRLKEVKKRIQPTLVTLLMVKRDQNGDGSAVDRLVKYLICFRLQLQCAEVIIKRSLLH